MGSHSRKCRKFLAPLGVHRPELLDSSWLPRGGEPRWGSVHPDSWKDLAKTLDPGPWSLARLQTLIMDPGVWRGFKS